MKKYYYILCILLAAPLYIILNNICFNVFNLTVNGHVNTFWYGFYYSLKKQEYTTDNNLAVIALGFLILRLALFALVFVKGTYQAAIQKVLCMILVLDLIGIILYTAFYFDLSGLFKIYFSFSSLFLASGNIFGVPFYLPAVLVIGECLLMSVPKGKVPFREAILFLVLALLSIMFWYGLRLLVVWIF